MIGTSGTRLRAFPPGRRGVLLPYHDRRTAAAGLTLYTASKPWVVRGQKAAFWVARLVGPRLLPGQDVAWDPRCSAADWSGLVEQWEGTLGPLTGFAAYQRRQASRTGLTLIATREGRGVALIKLRDSPESLEREQSALGLMHERPPTLFQVPRALGAGSVGELHWAAQECVFTRPHRAALQAPVGLYGEIELYVGTLLSDCQPTSPTDHGAPGHGDLTPWNLRIDHRGALWLIDWEDIGWGPADGDRTYFSVTAAALGGPPVPGDLSLRAVAHWRSVLNERLIANPEDRAFTPTVLEKLTAAEGLHLQAEDR